MTGNPQIAVCFERLGPYHVARLEAAASKGPIIAVEFYRRDATYSWEEVAPGTSFPRETLVDSESESAADPSLLGRRVSEVLDRTLPVAVAIPGWSGRGALAALRWCLRNRVPAILMSDSTSFDAPRHAVKEAIKSRIVRLFDSGLVAGSRAAAYAQSLGMAREHVFVGYDVVDNNYFAREAQRARDIGAAMRAELKLPEKYFLCCARFVPKKNHARLLRSFASFIAKSDGADWSLVLVGDGPLRHVLGTEIRSLHLESRVMLAGFQQYDRLPIYLGLAQALVLPSLYDQWGLAVNEAMAARLPVLVSQRCGCAPDLVQEGVNGFLLDPESEDSIESAMVRVSRRSTDLATMGAVSATLISAWGPERFSTGLWSAFESAKTRARRCATWIDRGIVWAAGRL